MRYSLIVLCCASLAGCAPGITTTDGGAPGGAGTDAGTTSDAGVTAPLSLPCNTVRTQRTTNNTTGDWNETSTYYAQTTIAVNPAGVTKITAYVCGRITSPAPGCQAGHTCTGDSSLFPSLQCRAEPLVDFDATTGRVYCGIKFTQYTAATSTTTLLVEDRWQSASLLIQ